MIVTGLKKTDYSRNMKIAESCENGHVTHSFKGYTWAKCPKPVDCCDGIKIWTKIERKAGIIFLLVSIYSERSSYLQQALETPNIREKLGKWSETVECCDEVERSKR